MGEQADLRVLLIEVTQKCNAKCDHCGSRCDIHSKECLSAEEILDALRDVKEQIGTDVMINITGGEPLMRKDLFQLMGEVDRLGFDWGMVTNGVLIGDEIIDQMRRTHMKTLTVSLDGMKQTHEKLRHLPGSFDVILRNLRKLKEADFLDHLQVTFTANKQNLHEFPALYELLNDIGIDSIRTSCIDPIGRAEENRELLLHREDMEYLIHFVNEKNKGNGIPIVWGCCHFLGDKLEHRRFECYAGKYIASILYNGDIFVCPNVPRRPELIQGNIRTDRLSKVWEEGFGVFRSKKEHTVCAGCKYKARCNEDSLHTWDFEKEKPKFCYRELFDVEAKKYKDYLVKKYQKFFITEVAAPEVAGSETACPSDIYIEPEAYEELQTYFHMGKKHPLSLYEQQMGLIGFRMDDDYVIKYVFPSYIHRVNGEIAIFHKETLRQAARETGIARKNFKYSDDRFDYVGQGLIFLGFAHSHPLQKDLQYSIGDEKLHQFMVKKYGTYIGILINPREDLIGAYYGETIRQGNLKIIEVKSGE
ncbi:MAG: radical SAM protein [Lachnospiraceae bacterium]|nr:radical SAM protein [Lachnospiraceae bacterium]